MRKAVAIVAVACLCACQFHRSAGDAKTTQPSARHHVKTDTSHVGSASDAAARADGEVVTADAAAMSTIDAHVPPVTQGGDGGGDGGQFGTNPTPHDPKPPALNGGLKCGNVFCPFATKPIEPCCTASKDVASGSALTTNRCGLQFKATGADFYGDHCWQRDQPGVVDDMCPGVQVDLHSTDPGCCNDRGTCGGIDTDHGLGCHADPGASAQSCAHVEPPDGGTQACDARGAYALRLSVDLAWGGRSGGLVGLTDDGRGTLVVELLAKIDKVDSSSMDLQGTMRVCGVDLPTFYSTTLCEAYQPIFPDAMFTNAAMPSFAIGGHLQCLAPGCIASIDAQTYLLGIELNNPEAPWPTADQTASLTCKSGTGADCFPDHDGDMLPGLTVPVATTGTSTDGTGCNMRYTNKGAPLSASVAAIFDGVRRTNRVALGVRMKIGASMKFGDKCQTGSGAGIAEFVNSRAWGCLVQPGTFNFPFGAPAGANEKCSAAEASFMDANLPIYAVLNVGDTPDPKLQLMDKSPSSGPQVSLVRLGDASAKIGCDDVRAAVHP